MSWITLAAATWIGLALLSARWGAMAAEGRGRPAAWGFLLGLALGPVGYLIAEGLPRDPDLGDGRSWESASLHGEFMSEIERGAFYRISPATRRSAA